MKQETPAKQPKKPNILARLLALLVTAALVLGALALVVFRDQLNLDALERWLTYRALETSSTGEAAPFFHAGGDKLSVDYLDQGALFSSAAGAHYYSFSGDLYAEEVLAMDNPVLSASSEAGVVYDAGGQALFLFRGNQEALDLSLEGGGDLLSARVNDSGWLAVTAQQSGYKGAVTVYNGKGERVIQISLSSTFVVDAALSPDCKTVAVVTMNQTAGSFASRVLFYPVDKTEPTMTADLGSAAVLDLEYENDLLWVLGENSLFTVSPSKGSVNAYSFGRAYLKGCSLGGDGFALLLLGRYRAGTADRAIRIDPDCEEEGVLPLSGQVLDFDSAGHYCVILTGSELTIYTGAFEPYALLNSTQGARYAAMGEDGSALLASTQEAWLFIPS